MKIAIPVVDKSMESTICVSFGRTPYFLIYETESKESLFLKNSAAESQGGAGIKAAQVIVDNNINCLITPRCGQNSAEVMNCANVIIYKTVNDTIKENIDAFLDGKLSLLEDIHACFHGHGVN